MNVTVDNQGNTKYTDAAEYFYNEYLDCYCVVCTTISTADLSELEEMFESPDLLTQIDMPSYITEDYDESEW